MNMSVSLVNAYIEFHLICKTNLKNIKVWHIIQFYNYINLILRCKEKEAPSVVLLITNSYFYRQCNLLNSLPSLQEQQ